jgi:hypothetical protein
MKPIKQLFVLVISLFLFQLVEAAESKMSFEPLYGIETALVRYPEPPRYVTRTMYGARILYGVTAFSGELEYTEAQSRKDYPGIDQKVLDKTQRASLGFRSAYALGSFLGIYARLGGRASQGRTEVTTAGITEEHDNPLRVDPYAGAGLQLAFASNFALNAGITMVRNAEDNYDSQYTLGLTARLGKL